jgi:predicted ABC-type ATPase
MQMKIFETKQAAIRAARVLAGRYERVTPKGDAYSVETAKKTNRIQKSFEKARKGGGLFGLKEDAKERY